MDEYNVINTQVILSVKSGRGFGFLDKSFVIEASLNGHNLETDVLHPSNEISIGAELLWEAEKKVLRRLRTGNVPLKVDCFTVVNGKKHEKVGYILLTLRAAKSVPTNSMMSDIPGTWHSLLGVKPEVKYYNPALLLNLCIEDLTISNSISKVHQTERKVALKYLPRLSLDKDLIEIGPDMPTASVFMLTVSLESGRNLHLLADSAMEIQRNFSFSCILMGCIRQGRTIPDLSSFSEEADIKFTVKISGPLNIISDYLQERELGVIKLASNGEDFAFCEISGNSLISNNDLQIHHIQQYLNKILTIKSRYYLKKSSTHQIPVSATGSRPFVDTVILLQYLQNANDMGLGQGDAENCRGFESINEPLNVCTNISWNLKDKSISDIDDGLREVKCCVQEWFTLNIIIESALVNKTSNVNKFYFRFDHTKAIVVLKHHQEVIIDKANQFIPVQGVACSLYLQGSLKDVQHDFLAHRPSIDLLAIVGQDCPSFASGEVDISLLLREQNGCSVLELKDITRGGVYGLIKLHMALDKVMIISREKHQKTPFPDTNNIKLLDSLMTEKAKKEIEEWKEQEKELFMAELKQIQLKHLNDVVEDWESRQKEYEIALSNNVQHCTELATSLSQATDELRSKSQIIAQKEAELMQIQSTLEIEYQTKLQECREASRRIEDDFKLEIKSLQVENKSLRDQIALQEEENARLLKMHKDQENELERLKRNTLTEDQTASLLKELKLAEEKYEDAFRSKIFFKEQWARVMREIHTIKSRHREEMSEQIRCSKEQLKNLGRMLLPWKPIQRSSAESLHPHSMVSQSSAQHEVKERTSNLEIDSLRSSTHSMSLSICSDKEDASDHLLKATLEQKLQELVQERDSLLNTGTYAMDHVLITKLNKHIRQLLSESNYTSV